MNYEQDKDFAGLAKTVQAIQWTNEIEQSEQSKLELKELTLFRMLEYHSPLNVELAIMLRN